MAFKTKVVLVVLLVALLIGVPPGLGQQSPEDSREDLYSIWIKLSMMGHKQSEIEGILNQKSLSIEEGATLKIKSETYK